MIPPPTNKSKMKVPIVAIVAGTIALCTLASATPAQEAIRVETNQILVQVFVLDKDHLDHLRNDPESLFRAALAGDMKVVDAITDGVVIRGLTTADFHVFDDGKEQIIQNVSYARTPYRDVRDNAGHHTEFVGSGGGKWSTVDWPPGLIADVVWPSYVIAYALPDSPENSCHRIRVTVNRRHALVGARNEYCNVKHDASDPIKGTKLDTQLESEIASAKDDGVDVSLLAIPLFTNGNVARVHISVDWSWGSRQPQSSTIGVLGLIFKKDGTPVTRFSELAGSADAMESEWAKLPNSGAKHDSKWTHYEIQHSLPAGAYTLHVVLGDGTRFGHAEIPLTVDGNERNELTISAISLCKRISDVAVNSSLNRANLPDAWGQKLSRDYEPLVSRGVEFELTGNTRFKKGGTLYTYFEVYEPLLVEGQSPATVQIQMRIFDSRTGEVISDSQPISAAPYIKAGSSIIPVGRGMDISKLPIGSYRLDVRATDSAGKSTAWRSANFTVHS
jgi:hypothetical protein